MTQHYSWPVTQAPAPVLPADRVVSPLERAVPVGAKAHLGRGLLRPFRRDRKNDYAHTEGEALVRACVGQVLGTKCSSDFTQGEIPWRTEFGSLLYFIRHLPNDDARQDLARYYIKEAVQRWEPRVRIRQANITRKTAPNGEATVMEIRLVYDVIAENVPGNNVILSGVQQTLEVAA